MKYFINIITIIMLIYILFNPNIIMKTINFSFNIWKNNVFTSLFPFLVLSNILISYGFINILSKIFGNLFNKIFHINPNASFIFFLSFFSGFPSNAKYIYDSYKKGLITEYDANKIILFTHFSNPLFIMGTISITFLNNKKIGLLILIVHYLTNIIIGLLFRNYNIYKEKNYKIYNNNINNVNFGIVFKESINSTINVLLSILGIITISLIFNTIIGDIFNFNNYLKAIISGFIEMTSGIKLVSLLVISNKIKTILITMILSFGGFCIHLQVFSILNDMKVKYINYLIARLLHSAISGLLIYLIYDFII